MDELANCHRTNTPLTTLVYAHGNQTDYDFGISRGVQFYRNLASCKELNGPIRMVLWLWKSEKESVRLYKDFRTKSKRAVEMGAALQTTLERLGDSRVALVGFSLGAQVILSALDSMEEQQACSFDGWDWSRSQGCLGCDSGYSEKYKVALIAPALDPAYACAAADRTVCSSLVDQTRVFNNRSDRAVKALRVIIRRECPQKSISFKKLVDEQRLYLGQVKHVDLSSEVGHRHSIVRYSRTESLCCELGNLVSDIFSEKIFANQPVPNNQIAVE
jgi:esterase/lipase superfamily enzyme